MDSDLEVEDNELSFFAENFQQMTSAPPSTPNSSASSPPGGINNEDLIMAPQGFLHNMLNQFDCGGDSSELKSLNSKRGPGRPRKDIPILMFRNGGGSSGINKAPQKRKSASIKDERVGGVAFSMAPSSSDSSNIGFPDEKPLLITPPATAATADDSPYFLEKYPGKVCCLCNLGERSALGQGDFLRLETSRTADRDEKVCDDSILYEDMAEDGEGLLNESSKVASVFGGGGGGVGIHASNACRRQKNAIKCKLPTNNNECVNELDKVGQSEALSLRALLDGSFIYVHRLCAMWSLGLNRSGACGVDEAILPPTIELVVAKSLKRKCSYCGQYGASIACKMSCPKTFHLPCAAAAGCFIIIENFTAFCADHLNHVPLICTPDSNIDCRQCFALGDISKLVMCSTCGDHYHTTCIGLVNLPDTKTGWNCSQCSKCQICRQSDSTEGRSIKCEQCQKLYHATCLRPIISSIPKYGWKCNRCRVCTDCGSRTPGAGTSSRWHCHYTICDSCYQQRNKGFSCPICHKAYRAAAHKEMVKCSWCNRFVHSSCDGEADLSVYHKHKENNPDYDYVCPYCKVASHNDKNQKTLSGNQIRFSIDSSDMTSLVGIPLGDVLCKNPEFDYFEKGSCIDNSSAADGKSFDTFRISKKRLNFKDFQQRSRGGKIVLQKTIGTAALTQFSRKRSTRGKNRHLMLLGGGSNTNIVGVGVTDRSHSSRSTEDELAIEKKLVLCSAKDKFILSQDICVMCGSVGNDQEGCLIACAQCGQCYHPYCVSIKVSKVVLQKGWRCLDCTVCEGCGHKNDEARLILCDECDISYHIYCMSPPLDTVPHGNWKCKWCAVCQKCGRTSPGKNASWQNSYLECGPCASQAQCSVCLQQYVDNELIIQCRNCERWLHCQCDAITNEEQAQLADNIEYHCVLCRPKDKTFSLFLADSIHCKSKTSPKTSQSNTSPSAFGAINNSKSVAVGMRLGGIGDRSSTINALNMGGGGVEPNECVETTHWVDGVCVSERGFNIIKSLTTEIKKKRKMRPANDLNTKDSGILAAIESVVANAACKDGTGATVHGMEMTQPAKKANENYKDGMVWTGGIDTSPPEGFSISTNDEGVNVLRKKRQRNLQKLGIGGFNVRNRTFKKAGEENADNSNNIQHETEKKKKIIRKKLKNKLSETYPIYLQEAFFGKSLLDTTETHFSLCESESSDEFENSSVDLLCPNKNTSSEEKSTTPQQNRTAQEQHKKSSTVKIKMEIDAPPPPPIVDNKTNVSSSLVISAQVESTAAIKVESRPEVLSNKVDGGSKDVITLPQQGSQNTVDGSSILPIAKILEINEDFTDNSIVSENVTETVSNVMSLIDHISSGITAERDVKSQSDELCSNNFGLQLNRKKTDSSANIKPQLTENPICQNSVHTLQQPLLHIQNVSERLPHVQNPITVPNSSTMTDKPLNTMQLNHQSKHASAQPESFLQQQTLVCNESSSKLYLTPTLCEEPIEAIAAGTQKTAEKMRRDEDLGEMATISAVLYANTQHPELKQIYPNWNDRCKQILKRWRSLSTDKKAPFLQNAKDNRSALRMRRAQQDQEKICFQQKTLKEQEQERIWKQHQAKAKEAHINVFCNEANAFDPNFNSAEGCSADEKRSLIYTTNLVSESTQNSFSPNNITSSLYSPSIRTVPIQRKPNPLNKSNPTLEKSDCPQISETGNKQLRTLLLKQASSWLSDANTSAPTVQSALFSQSDNNFKLNMLQEPQKIHPVQCNVDVVKRNIPDTKNVTITHGLQVMQQEQTSIKNDIKSRYDNKNVDNTEAVGVSAELDKLDQDENAGFGDILGGLGEGDDDDLLKSLTAEMGDDFNILEYADPELDELATNQNLLSKLDFDDNDKNN